MKRRAVAIKNLQPSIHLMLSLTEQLSMHLFNLDGRKVAKRALHANRWFKERLYVLNRNIFYFIYSIL